MYSFKDDDMGDVSTFTLSSDDESCVEKEVVTSDKDSDVQITHVVPKQKLSSSALSVSLAGAAPDDHPSLSLS